MTEIFPAIDMSEGKVVRLLKGDYNQKTIYGDSPAKVAKEFEEAGAKYIHLVDLDGAKDGNTPAFDAVKEISDTTSLKIEIGGGIRSEETIQKYLDAGVSRVILGTIAVTDPEFTANMLKKYGDKIAIGIDIKDGHAAIKGWLELSEKPADEIFVMLCEAGAKTIICTDISKDGAMQGISEAFYKELADTYTTKYGCKIVASGGVTTIADIERLSGIGLEGIIIGRALYNGSVDLAQAISVVKEKEQ